MRLKKVIFSNFRCLKDVEVSFDGGFTVFVGENDSGKSSLLDALRVAVEGGVFEGRARSERVRTTPDPADFYAGEAEMRWELNFADNEGGEDRYIFVFRKDENNEVSREIKRKVRWGKLRHYLDDPTACDRLGVNEVKQTMAQYGITTQRRSLEPLKEEFRRFLEDNRSKIEGDLSEEVSLGRLPDAPKVYHVDGKKFEDIEAFMKEVYLAEAIREVWREKVPAEREEKDLATILQEKLEILASPKKEEINREVLPGLREFIPGLQRIALDVRPSCCKMQRHRQ